MGGLKLRSSCSGKQPEAGGWAITGGIAKPSTTAVMKLWHGIPAGFLMPAGIKSRYSLEHFDSGQ